jgi:hypothetical protein
MFFIPHLMGLILFLSQGNEMIVYYVRMTKLVTRHVSE